MYYFIELTLRIASFLTLMLVCVCQEGGLGGGGGVVGNFTHSLFSFPK